MLDETKGQIRASLLAFVDFLYAVVFGIIVAQLVDQVIVSDAHFLDKAGRTFLVIGVFYFLTWDWLHGRLLTLKYPYVGYRRFFLEVIIAFAGYGAARSAINGEIAVLVYLGIMLLLGAYWAKITLHEYPNNSDHDELLFILRFQTAILIIQAPVVVLLFLFWGPKVPWWGSTYLNLLGMSFIFVYELRFKRAPGLLGGPGVPFVGRERMARVRLLNDRMMSNINSLLEKWRKRK